MEDCLGIDSLAPHHILRAKNRILFFPDSLRLALDALVVKLACIPKPLTDPILGDNELPKRLSHNIGPAGLSLKLELRWAEPAPGETPNILFLCSLGVQDKSGPETYFAILVQNKGCHFFNEFVS